MLQAGTPQGEHDVVVVRGCDERIQADIAVLHVDLTVVLSEYLEYIKRFPVALNARGISASGSF